MIERQVVCADLGRSIDDLRREGFRLDVIYPADEPHTAVLSKGRESVRLTNRPELLLQATHCRPSYLNSW